MVELAEERFGVRVHDLVRADVAVLCEALAAGCALVGAFAGVAALVGFEVAELGEALVAGRVAAEEGFAAGVRSEVDVEVGFLGEGLAAAGEVAVVTFLGLSGPGAGWFYGLRSFGSFGIVARLGLDCPHQSVDVGREDGWLTLVRCIGYGRCSFG